MYTSQGKDYKLIHGKTSEGLKKKVDVKYDNI
jgi:hypothetical protein